VPVPDQNISSCVLFQAPFIFLRHGETEPNRLGLTAGMSDVPLNTTGRQQARDAAAALVGRGIEAIYSSPLQRALETARCVSDMLHLPIVIIPGIAERNWGALEGKPRELRVREADPPGGEDLAQFRRRTLAGLAQIPAGGLPLIVAHSGTFRILCGELDIDIQAQVENCRPLRFGPPRVAGARWAVEPL
jgi:broad specificity phosphatase PhoE